MILKSHLYTKEVKEIMDSFLEKVTLYDFFSYFVPGTLCLALIACGLWPELEQYQANINDYFYGYIGFALIIFSYVIGIALSSIAYLLCMLILYLFRHVGKRLKWLKEPEIDEEALKYALLKSGVSKKSINCALENVPDEKQGRFLAKYFGRRIYADIQVDSTYKRIHNYSSSASMYKNITFAFLVGGAMPWILKELLQVQILKEFKYLLVLEIGLAGIFWFRWKRFEEKKNLYALNWFLEKYAAADKGTDGKEAK